MSIFWFICFAVAMIFFFAQFRENAGLEQENESLNQALETVGNRVAELQDSIERRKNAEAAKIESKRFKARKARK